MREITHKKKAGPHGVRGLAVRTLGQIESGRLTPKKALSEPAMLSKRDRAFLMELVYGTLRQRGLLDWVLSGFLQKKPGGLYTLNNLRMALYQLLFTRVAERAAVFEAVQAERANNYGKPALVNAVLRNFLRKRESVEARRKELENRAETGVEIPAVSIITSHPLWLVKRWSQRFGPGEALALCRADNEVPPLTLRLNLMKTKPEEFLLAGRFSRTLYSPAGVRAGKGVIFSGLEGRLRAVSTPQDEAAQLVSYIVGPHPGERVLDAASAPGGKATHMAELMGDTGFIAALDIDEGRVALMQENIERLGLASIHICRADILAQKPSPEFSFDRVLLDAPCSSLGVIRRNPDIKYRHTEKDLGVFHEKQFQMLLAASRFLKKGGTLVYSVCSTEPEEGEDVIARFLLEAETGSFVVDAPRKIPFLEALLDEKGYMRTYPHRHNMDGFFAARLKKIA